MAITKADILPGYKTDHSLITLHLANDKEFTIEDAAVCPGGLVAPWHLYVNDVTINHFSGGDDSFWWENLFGTSVK